MAVDGGLFPLGRLRDRYFRKTRGGRIAYVVDTLWSDASRPSLVELCQRANRLFCDSFYAKSERKQATTHRHMTATHAAELARAAKVDQLVLIHFSTRYAGRYEDLVSEAAAVFPNTVAMIDEAGGPPPPPPPRRPRRGR